MITCTGRAQAPTRRHPWFFRSPGCGYAYLLLCPVPHSHQALACAFALTRDGVVSPDLSPRCVVTQLVVRVITRHSGSLLTPRARGNAYLPSCTITTSHQTPACAIVVPREGDSRVDFYMMLIANVHVHLVLECNRRHIPMLLTAFCCGYVYLLHCAVLHSHQAPVCAFMLPWTVREQATSHLISLPVVLSRSSWLE